MEKASDLIAALPNHPPNYRPSGSIGVKFALDTGRFLKDVFLTRLRRYPAPQQEACEKCGISSFRMGRGGAERCFGC